MKNLISVSLIAKRMELSQRRLEQIINQCAEYGDIKLIRPNRGVIDSVEFFITYLKMINEKQSETKSKGSEIDKANLRLRLAQAESAEVELRIKNELLIPKDISIRFITNIFGNVRNKLLSSPNRIAFQVFGSKSLPESKVKVRKIIHEILNELSDPEYLFKKNKKLK